MPVDFKVDYSATEEQLLRKGVPQRTITLAKSHFIRPGAVDMDTPYALAVWDARDTLDLAALAINNPGKHVWFPPHDPYMGICPNK